MNASQLALSDAPASWPPALYNSNARSLSSIARSYSRSIIATLLSPLSTSGLSPCSSTRSRHARAVSQSAAAIARSPPRSRSSRAWTPMAADHLIRATDQPANRTPWASGRARYLRDSLTRNQHSDSDRRKCRLALGADVSHRGRRDARSERETDHVGRQRSLLGEAGYERVVGADDWPTANPRRSPHAANPPSSSDPDTAHIDLLRPLVSVRERTALPPGAV